MIVYLEGKLLNQRKEERYRVVDVLTTSGIGYEVIIPDRVKVEGDSISLHTHFVVRDDAQTLYGFEQKADKNLFQMLISVSGVGPKIAISIMSTFSSSDIISMILADDHKTLGKTPGLGSRGSQKIVLELRDKVSDLGYKMKNYNKGIEKEVVTELKNALKSLGFGGDAIKGYVDEAEKILEAGYVSVEELLKMVLRQND